MKSKIAKSWALIMGSLLLSASLQATVVLQPASVTSSTGSLTGFDVSRIIDKSGLSVGYTSGFTDYQSYVASATHTGSSGTYWLAGSTTVPMTLSFDLGSMTSVNSMAAWNISGPGRIVQFELFTDNDQNFGNGGTVSLGTFFTSAVSNPSSAQVFDFGFTTTQFIHLRVLSLQSTGSRPALGEVVFAQVPEPAAGLLAGLAALSIVLVRRARRGREQTA